MEPAPVNPLDPTEPLAVPDPGVQRDPAHPPQPPLATDSAVTKAEKLERNAPDATPSALKRKAEPETSDVALASGEPPRKRGVASIKPEFVPRDQRL